MKTPLKYLLSAILLLSTIIGCKATEETPWVQPSASDQTPVWGFRNGIRIGLHPASIRGLIHIYAPYIDHREDQVINFIAIEPVVRGDIHRGFSELEFSALDSVAGKRIWSADTADDPTPQQSLKTARGVTDQIGGVETLTIFLFVEPFINGASVYIRVRFYADRPHEVELSTFHCDGSAELENCIVTATMGNYARLRILWLDGQTLSAKELWPDYTDDAFAPHTLIAHERMIRDDDEHPYFVASPNEKDPSKAVYDERVPFWWRYTGHTATQYWYCKTPKKELQGIVNGRVVYWGDLLPIPGGISYENFELKQPYSYGDAFVFGVTPLAAESFVKTIRQ